MLVHTGLNGTWLNRHCMMMAALTNHLPGCAGNAPPTPLLKAEPMAEKTVVAREFLLKDPQGDTRGRLGFYGSDDSPRIRLIDSVSHERVSIGIANDHPGVGLLNSNASTSLIIGCMFPETSGVMINDERGLLGTTLEVRPGYPAKINIFDPEVEEKGIEILCNVCWSSSQSQQ